MKKRAMAWIVLALFLVLIANLLVFRIQWQASLIIYAGIVLYYVFAFKK